MKIIYTIAGFYRPAGMERVLANKATWLSDHGYEVMIVTTEQQGRERAFALPEKVQMVDLGIGYENTNGASFLRKLLSYPAKQCRHRRALRALLLREKADVVVSMFCGDERFLTRIADGSRKVLEVHFSRFKRLQYGRKGIWALADRLRSAADLRVASRFDRFVVLTEEDLEYWAGAASATGIKTCKPLANRALRNICCIPNARTFSCEMPASLEAHRVIAVGRYSAQKNLGDLLRAWALVLQDKSLSDWRLALVGNGEDKAKLMQLAADLGIADSVDFGPAAGDIKEVYSNASVLALTSLYEGLPMVLLEAQASGLPIVAYECQCGPRDVITDGVDGFLVPQGNVPEFAARLSELMASQPLRSAFGAAAFSASDRFDEDLIMSRWTRLFEEVVA